MWLICALKIDDDSLLGCEHNICWCTRRHWILICKKLGRIQHHWYRISSTNLCFSQEGEFNICSLCCMREQTQIRYRGKYFFSEEKKRTHWLKWKLIGRIHNIINCFIFWLAFVFILVATEFWNPDRTVRSDRKTLKPFIFMVLLASRTALWEKNRNPCEPRLDLPVLRTVIRPLLTVPCFHLNLNLYKKKKKKKKKKETQLLEV